MMPPSYLSNKEDFLDTITEKLARAPLDFLQKAPKPGKISEAADTRGTAGVLLLLNFKETPAAPNKGDFSFLLIKRSANVAQPGDISCPGGMLHPPVDLFLDRFVRYGFLPNLKGKGWAYAHARDKETYRLITLYLTNALRESWEEIRLNPFNLRFLGPFATYDLILFRRTIFPLVGFIEHPWRFRPNHEVEQIVEIPLRSFYDQASFARFVIGYRDREQSGQIRYGEFPCLACRDDLDREHVLWGATFYIIINFLKTVAGYELPDWQSQRTIERDLPDNYTRGHK